MKPGNTQPRQVFLVFCLAALLAACGSTPAPPTAGPPDATATPPATPAVAPTATSPAPEAATVPAPEAATATPSPTPTAAPLVSPPTATPAAASRCQGLAGTLELQVLVGPAEAVGLEPVAVGQVPFAVTTQQAPYQVAGQAPISYQATLQEAWGTYAVTMDLEAAVSGECGGEAGSEQLDLVLDISGEQLVVVDAEGFHGEYPWSGAQSRNLVFPLQEGATAQGEGWVVVLHLGGSQ
jgi:hypothetical protein